MYSTLRRIETRILLYFNIVVDGCRSHIDCCDYTPYYCGYSESSERSVNSYELCLFATGKIKCPGEIEKHYIEKHNKSTYRSIIRAVESLERKGFIQRVEDTEMMNFPDKKWYMTYKLVRKELN